MARPGDYHIHTHLPGVDDGDPAMTPAAVAGRLRERGGPAFGFSPHFHAGADFSVLIAFHDAAARAVEGILPYWRGVEAECVDASGRLTLSAEQADRLDYVLASADHFNCGGVVRPPRDAAGTLALHQALLLALAAHPHVDVVTHPWAALSLLTVEGHLPGHEPIPDLSNVPDGWFRDFAVTAARHRTAVEISGFYVGAYARQRADAGVPYHARYFRFFEIMAEEGVCLAPGSDAHRPDALAQHDDAVAWLERLGVPQQQVWAPGRRGRA